MKYLGSISDSTSHVTKEYVDDAIDKKADKDGVYPDMTVGMTRDMLGVGEGDEGEFLFRPTDGDGSIKDGFASIERIEGNSVVWNQICRPFSDNAVGKPTKAIINEDGATIEGWYAYNPYIFPSNLLSRIGHKCILAFSYSNTTPTPSFDVEIAGSYTTRYSFTKDKEDIALYLEILPDSSTDNINVFPTTLQTGVVILSNLCFIDLTRMFGAGNEPSTIEEFYQRIPKGIDTNAYNEGEVVNLNVEGIKSVGFNAWDEQWEFGHIIPSTGANQYYDDNTIRSIGFIRVVGGSKYYIQFPASNFVSVIFFDKNKNVIGDLYIYWSAEFETPSNCAYIRFFCDGYGSTYNNDICIHLVHTGYRNGEYEPYISDEIALPIADYFPNGMNSIGDVKDEINAAEAIQRVGVMDLGTLPWYLVTGKDNAIIMTSNGISGLATVPSDSETKAKILSPKYAVCTDYQVAQNNVGVAVNAGGDILIYDPSYTDVASFKAAMSGVMLYYELAEPIVTSIDKPLALDYQVWDFGTEEAIAEGKTTPLKGSIVYEFNARDTIRANKLALKNKADKTYVDNAIAQAIISTINANY